MLQGYDTGAFPEREKQVFLKKLRHSVNYEPSYQADLYFIHDFQLVPLAEFFPWMRPAIWFCHVDTAHPTPSAQHYIRQFLDPYAIACFKSQASIFKGLPPEKAKVVTLGIDPFRVKNHFLPRARGMKILARCGIDPERPLITQVSRFGTWKNPWQVIGTHVTGLEMQISHGFNGYLVDETEAAAAYTLELLQDRERWRALGRYAQETVRQRFLFPVMILDYLKALAHAQTEAHAFIEPKLIPIDKLVTSHVLVA
jgi:glycosyltransferase involved in cell wall biosynthesis